MDDADIWDDSVLVLDDRRLKHMCPYDNPRRFSEPVSMDGKTVVGLCTNCCALVPEELDSDPSTEFVTCKICASMYAESEIETGSGRQNF